jgi:hypothetical protein
VNFKTSFKIETKVRLRVSALGISNLYQAQPKTKLKEMRKKHNCFKINDRVVGVNKSNKGWKG